MKRSIDNILKSYGFKVVSKNYKPIKEIIGFNDEKDLHVEVNITEEDVKFYYVDEYGDENSSFFLTTEECKIKNELLERIYYENSLKEEK